MRDAFGGAFMIRLFLVFIFVYMFFTAMALNYAKAFKVKNMVINYLQDNEVIDLSDMHAAEVDKMYKYFNDEILAKQNYKVNTNRMDCDYDKEPNIVHCQDGIKIIQITPNKEQTNKLGTYYKVETYFAWDIWFLEKLTALTSSKSDGTSATGIWKISGETRPIVKQ